MSSVKEASLHLHLSVPTLQASAKHLVQLGILRELKTGTRHHVFLYDRYLDILNEEEDDAANFSPNW